MKTYNIYTRAIKPMYEYLNGEAKKIASALYASAKEEYTKALEYYNSSIEYYKKHDGYSSYPDKPDSKEYYKKAYAYSNMKDSLLNFCRLAKKYDYNLPWDVVLVAEKALEVFKNFESVYRLSMYEKKYYFSLTHYMESFDVYEGLSMEWQPPRTIGSTPYSFRGDEIYLNVGFAYTDIILVKVED